MIAFSRAVAPRAAAIALCLASACAMGVAEVQESPKEPAKELVQAPAQEPPQESPQDPPKESPQEPPQDPPKESPQDPPKEPAQEPRKKSPRKAPKESPKDPPQESTKREEREERERESKFVEPTTLGSSLATSDLFEAAANALGQRTQFDPIPADVAFEFWLDGIVPEAAGVGAPPSDPSAVPAPAAATTIPVLRISMKEWDDYYALMTKDAPPGMLSKYRTGLLTTMLDQKAMLLHYRSVVPDIEQRAAAAIRKLKRGASFRDVVKGHSEDDTSKQIGGLCADDSRSGLMTMYPFAKVMFEMEEGQITGPIYNKSAAYILHLDSFTRSNNPWYDKATASGICIRYSSKNIGGKTMGIVKSAIRVRTEQERFKKILPPAMQVPVPTTYGPTDIAPLGQPDAPLSHD